MRVNTIKYAGYRKKSGQNVIGLYIDDRDLLEHLEDAFLRFAPAGSSWASERNDCRVNGLQLSRSVHESGAFDFIDTNVANNLPGDVLLASAFKIEHDDEIVTCTINPPGAEIEFEEFEPMLFLFSVSQFRSAIQKLLSDLSNPLVKQPDEYLD